MRRGIAIDIRGTRTNCPGAEEAQRCRIDLAEPSPPGHYRMPFYLRGKRGTVEAVVEPAAIDNEEEGYGRNAGTKLHYYRIAIPMTEIWPDYVGSPRDGLRIKVCETWLEGI